MPTTRQERSPSLCALVREGLAEYDYGGPGWWQRRRIERHLRRCPECAAELDALRQATSLLATLPAVSAPSGMWERLEREMDRMERVPLSRARRFRRRPALVALGTAAALLAGVSLWRGHNVAEQPPAVTSGGFVRSHLALSLSDPLSPGAGLETLALAGREKGSR